METSVHFPKPCCGPSGNQTFAAGLVTKVGTGEHPTQRAAGLFYARVDADPEWYPGKRSSSVSSSSSSPTSTPPPSEGAPSSCRRHPHFRHHLRPSLSSAQVASSSSASSCLRLSFVIVLFAIRTAIARHTFVEQRCTMSPAIHWGSSGDPLGIQGGSSAKAGDPGSMQCLKCGF